jgi:hypothetical protein
MEPAPGRNRARKVGRPSTASRSDSGETNGKAQAIVKRTRAVAQSRCAGKSCGMKAERDGSMGRIKSREMTTTVYACQP